MHRPKAPTTPRDRWPRYLPCPQCGLTLNPSAARVHTSERCAGLAERRRLSSAGYSRLTTTQRPRFVRLGLFVLVEREAWALRVLMNGADDGWSDEKLLAYVKQVDGPPAVS